MSKKKSVTIVIIAILGLALLAIILVPFLGSMNKKLPEGVMGGVVKEVLQTSSYTYLNVEGPDSAFWMAISSSDFKTGDSVYFRRSMVMTDFKSRELNRTFPSILFVEDPMPTLVTSAPVNQQMTPQKVEVKKWTEISVDKAPGGVTLEELFRDVANHAGKKVTVRGVAVRYNSEIMKRNWIHIQDGTEFETKFDLAVTSSDSIKVGQTATFTGVIGLNRDFGYGYTYDVIMEDAVISEIK